MKKILLALAALTAGLQASGSTEPAATLKSPDGNLELSFWLENGGVPKYSLTHKGTDVVLPSLLGFELRGTVKAEKINFDGDEITKTDVRPCYSFAEGFELTGTAPRPTPSTRCGSPCGERSPRYATTTTNCS